MVEVYAGSVGMGTMPAISVEVYAGDFGMGTSSAMFSLLIWAPPDFQIWIDESISTDDVLVYSF